MPCCGLAGRSKPGFLVSSSTDNFSNPFLDLNVTLPETIENLKALFLFIHRNLMLTDLEHDEQNITNALNILQQYRDIWIEVMKRSEQASAPAAQQQLLAPHFQTWGDKARSQPGPHISANRDSSHIWTT